MGMLLERSVSRLFIIIYNADVGNNRARRLGVAGNYGLPIHPDKNAPKLRHNLESGIDTEGARIVRKDHVIDTPLYKTRLSLETLCLCMKISHNLFPYPKELI